MKPPEYYKYYVGRKGNKNWNFDYPIVVTLRNEGINFNKRGSGIFRTEWCEEITKLYCDPITFEQALLYLTSEGRITFCKTLDIDPNFKKIEITDKDIIRKIKLLVKNCAFNGDCAHKIMNKDWYIFNHMKEKGIVDISCLDDSMYYLCGNYKDFLKHE